jgi:hypothetical protein
MSDINLVLTSPHITGPIVTQFQKDMNTRLRAWDVPYQVDVDGDYGQDSRDTARSILYGLGVDLSNEDFDGVSARTGSRSGTAGTSSPRRRRSGSRTAPTGAGGSLNGTAAVP